MINARTYQQQFFKILDERKTIIRYNGEWFSKLTFEQIMELAAKFTVARMLERDDFANRYKNQLPISIHEFFYPLMQGYDSVMIDADVELGATEQKFNLVIARQIQKEFGKEEQIVLTLPVLEGVDGVQRMSKSLGNYIGIDEPPKEIYGKTLSIPDQLIYPYFELISDVDLGELARIKKQLENPQTNPRDVKRYLARTLVRMYHNAQVAQTAEQEFDQIFIDKKLPAEIPEFQLPHQSYRLDDLLVETRTTASKGEARRLIQQGGVTIDNQRIEDPFKNISLSDWSVLKVGKRKFIKIKMGVNIKKR
jgi:tyrosyl-tRNA synthetase